MSASRAPRVAFDTTIVDFDSAGSAVYARSLFDALTPLLGDRLIPVSFGMRGALIGKRSTRSRLATLARDIWWTPFGSTSASRATGADVRHNPAFFAPARSAIPTVVTIHDLAVLRTPERFRPWFRNYAARALPHTVRIADRIITGSEASREDIVERLGADAARVVVTPYGVAPHLTPLSADDPQSRAVRARYALPPRYILAVGSIEPRKNLPALLDALRIMRTLPGCEDAQLVHAGPLGWLAEDVPRSLATRGLEGAVRFLGYVSEGDLHALYAQARMVAYPSLFEGFGFPVLEAMACGAPVVTSNVSSLPEVAGTAALLVDPMQSDAIADAMAQLWQDDTLHAELRARGLARAAAFTWRRTAEATDAVYRSLA